nr:hypothetical protein [Dendronalium sp. ChiSLP03b]
MFIITAIYDTATFIKSHLSLSKKAIACCERVRDRLAEKLKNKT